MKTEGVKNLLSNGSTDRVSGTTHESVNDEEITTMENVERVLSSERRGHRLETVVVDGWITVQGLVRSSPSRTV